MIQNGAAMLPTLNGNASQNYNFGRSLDSYTYQPTESNIVNSSFSLNSGLILFNGFQMQNNLKQSVYDYMAGKYDTQKLQNDIILNVINSYLQVLYAKEAVKNAKDQQSVAQSQLARMSKLVETGTMAANSLFQRVALRVL